jgi:SSS family solute:Na+ symporter
LKVDLLLLDLMGWNLSQNSYAFNETLTMLVRLFLPMSTLVVVSLLTPPDDETRLSQFFGKMRTKVVGDHDLDAKEMELTRQNPHRNDHLKLFPGSNWEFRKWDREDWTGAAWSTLGALGLLVVMALLVNLGS